MSFRAGLQPARNLGGCPTLSPGCPTLSPDFGEGWERGRGERGEGWEHGNFPVGECTWRMAHRSARCRVINVVAALTLPHRGATVGLNCGGQRIAFEQGLPPRRRKTLSQLRRRIMLP